MNLEAVYQAVVDGDAPGVEAGVRLALEHEITPEVILREGLVSAMHEVGRRFQVGDFFVPEMLIAARAMKTGVGVLKPFFTAGGIKPSGKVVIGTVPGDIHDIGKNLVGLMLEGAGFEVIDIGVDVPADKFIAAIRREKPLILGLSALLTTTVAGVGEVTEALSAAGLRNGLIVIAGGAAMTEASALEMGADGYAQDAARAVDKVKELSGLG